MVLKITLCIPLVRMLTKEALERTVGFPITKFELYHQAFVHKSCATPDSPSYERLEFIGDSVINLVVAKWLFDSFGQHQEGFLTKIRTKLVSGKCLSKLAAKLELHRFIMMNERGLSCGWHRNERILEDCMEALVGAIYLSEGLIVARTFLLNLYGACVNFDELMCEENFKDVLMRWTQANGLPLPEYVVVDMKPGIKPLFEIHVQIDGVTYGSGKGHAKKIAQQEAARHTLSILCVPHNF